MKQAAIDPSSGKIDISILTTGLSGSHRRRRAEVAAAVKKILLSRGSSSQEQAQFSYQPIFTQLKENSAIMVTRDMFEDALKDLQDEGFLSLFGGKFIRLTNSI